MNKRINILIIGFCLLVILPSVAQQHVFYLHGKIIEIQGPNAVDQSNGYGAYLYYPIIDSLRKNVNIVHSEVRPKDTDVRVYAKKISNQIDSLIQQHVQANKITVVGASKGAIIAMYVSTYLKNKDVNFVFMAACYEDDSYSDMNWYGNILSIYEKSDVAGTCLEHKKKASNIHHYKEIELHTGLRHGFLFKPIPEWVNPALDWSNGKYD